MAYAFQIDERINQGLRRIAAEQLDELLAELQDDSIPVHGRVHSARKRCKKVRGLLRLVRSGLGPMYCEENEAIRDAGRLLSAMRDSQTMIDAFKKLATQSQPALDEATAIIVRDGLLLRQHAIFGDSTAVNDRLREFHDRISAVRHRVDDWRIAGGGRAAILAGAERTYARGQQLMATALDARSADAFHEWRKRVKDHWTHVLLLENLWQPIMTAYGDQLKRLSDLLGDDHDLTVIAAELQATPSDFGGADAVASVTMCAARQREQLQLDAQKLGERLYASTPKQFTRRLRGLWRAWKKSA